ncbi:TPA: hypothetical protein ACV8E1_003603 [Escherichia coli]|uniref:hypothetical protein n=1 Tax=Escherichia coli TaxID=562 RepID=UPI001FCE4F61|nr:hypothetical protein [Escherichia coli]
MSLRNGQCNFLCGLVTPGRRLTLRELADVAGIDDMVNALCLDISKHDGLGQEDEAQLKKISQALQLPLEQCL